VPPLTAEQKEQRRQGIGSSEVGAIIGVDPFRSRLDVMLEKLGHEAKKPDWLEETARVGHIMEPIIAYEFFAPRNNLVTGELYDQKETMVHPDIPWAMATCDFHVKPWGRKPYPLECKNRSYFQGQKWGESEDGPEAVPPEILAQVDWQMFVGGFDKAAIAVLIGGNDYRQYFIDRDNDRIDMLLAKVLEFKTNHLDAGVLPEPVDSSEAALVYPEDNGVLLMATPEIDRLAAELFDIRETFTAVEEEKERLETAFKAKIGEHEGVFGKWGKALWRNVKGKASTNWEALARKLGATDKDIEAHTSRGAGHRRFTFNYSPLQERMA
jgi:putative phage-type endonuclease